MKQILTSYIRLKGRFENVTKMGNNDKYRIILRDGNSGFTKLLILKAHEDVLHYGIEFALNKIRSKFWMVRGRKAVKTLLRKGEEVFTNNL